MEYLKGQKNGVSEGLKDMDHDIDKKELQADENTKLILELSKENIELSRMEARSLLGDIMTYAHYAIAKHDGSRIYEHLSYTKKASKIIFLADKDRIKDMLSNDDLSRYIDGSYAIRVDKKTGLSDKEIADILKIKAKVDLKSPDTTIEFTLFQDSIIVSRLLWKNDEDFEKRKAHNRPQLHPTSLHPKLARSCINLTGIRDGKIIDPFCGSGGILIEAGLMGLETEGWDIDPIMLNRARINLKHFGIVSILREKDAREIEEAEYIVCDPPYGKNTKQKDTQKIYDEFLSMLDRTKVRRAVIIHPDWISIKTRLEIIFETKIHVHKSLTRIISVLGRN